MKKAKVLPKRKTTASLMTKEELREGKIMGKRYPIGSATKSLLDGTSLLY